LAQPHQALMDIPVALPAPLLAFVGVLDVVPDRQAADRAGGHRPVRLVFRVVLIAPAVRDRLARHAAGTGDPAAARAGAARHAGLRAGHAGIGTVHAAFDQVLRGALLLLLALTQPLDRGIDHLVLEDDARVGAGAAAERGVLRVRVVVPLAV